jgi:hypothetical protein
LEPGVFEQPALAADFGEVRVLGTLRNLGSGMEFPHPGLPGVRRLTYEIFIPDALGIKSIHFLDPRFQKQYFPGKSPFNTLSFQ